MLYRARSTEHPIKEISFHEAIKQLQLISKIGRHLQANMTTKEINVYMNRFRVNT